MSKRNASEGVTLREKKRRRGESDMGGYRSDTGVESLISDFRDDEMVQKKRIDPRGRFQRWLGREIIRRSREIVERGKGACGNLGGSLSPRELRLRW